MSGGEPLTPISVGDDDDLQLRIIDTCVTIAAPILETNGFSS